MSAGMPEQIAAETAYAYTLAIASALGGAGSWDDVTEALVLSYRRAHAFLSGAEHELAYYGGDQ